MNNAPILIMVQGFYGNRTVTELGEEKIGWLLLGWIGEKGIKFGKMRDSDIYAVEKLRIPNTDYIMVYNPIVESRISEEEKKNRTPLGFIPELGLKIYSRCIICRIDEDGNFASLISDDFEKVEKYLAE